MTRTLTLTTVRRLAITRQHLAGKPSQGTPEAMLSLVRDLGCLQLDPTSAVARSHLLVLWSRLGQYDAAVLDKLLWEDRSLFEYWAHAASMVLTEDYPIHACHMRSYQQGETAWGSRMPKWAAENAALRDHILEEITQKGALPSKHFEDKSDESWQSTGWTGNRNVSQMLTYLWTAGILMVSFRKGSNRYWDLTERFLPNWTPHESLDWPDVVRKSALKSLHALGVATPRQIREHFTRFRYPGVDDILKQLKSEGIIQQVGVELESKGKPEPWYIHNDDLALVDALEGDGWEPRTTLLSPFDNLICDRARTTKLFNFDFTIEIYVPKEKRKFGYYVLPILHGDRLIGRIDPLMDRKQNKFVINNVYTEPDAPMNRKTAQAVSKAIESLAGFLGAKSIEYGANIPDGWKSAF
jgi:uncharacterized protein YcaQ